MIPYDELVVALAAWRARQGLPVAQISGALTPPARPTPQPRTAPPNAPPGRPTPMPLEAAEPSETHDEQLEIDEAALMDEAQYDKDFSYAFGSLEKDGESTAIGVSPPTAPARPSVGEETMLDDAPPTLKPKKGKGRGGRSDW